MDVIGILYVCVMTQLAAVLLAALLGIGPVLLLALRVRAGLGSEGIVSWFKRSLRDLFPAYTAYRCLTCG